MLDLVLQRRGRAAEEAPGGGGGLGLGFREVCCGRRGDAYLWAQTSRRCGPGAATVALPCAVEVRDGLVLFDAETTLTSGPGLAVGERERGPQWAAAGLLQGARAREGNGLGPFARFLFFLFLSFSFKLKNFYNFWFINSNGFKQNSIVL